LDCRPTHLSSARSVTPTPLSRRRASFSFGAQENWKYDSNYGANYVLPVE